MSHFKSLFTLAAVSLLAITGCQSKPQGPLERAGERVDEIADNVRDGEAPLKRKGPLERAGESIDETLKGEK